MALGGVDERAVVVTPLLELAQYLEQLGAFVGIEWS